MNEIKISPILITPAIASQMLNTSKGNPRYPNGSKFVDEKTVDRYAKMMSRGEWYPTGETIQIDEDGALNNGHHRLSAIVKCGIPQSMFVAYGVPTISRKFIDTGKSRDKIGLMMHFSEKIPDELRNKKAFAIANSNFVWENLYHRGVLETEKEDFICKYADELITTQKICFAKNRNHICETAAFMYSIFCAVMCGVDKQTLTEFCDIVQTGICYDKNKNSAIYLRNWLMSQKRGQTMRSYEFTNHIQTALRDFISNKEIARNYNSNRCHSYYTEHFKKYIENKTEE